MQTIESVLSQTYKNWEMLIVDDASPDNSNEIIARFMQSDNRIKLFKLEINSGPAIARNKAIGEAKGRYIAFLDADDVWFPEKLEKQIDFMKEKKLFFTYSSYLVIDEEDKFIGKRIALESITYNNMLCSNKIGCLTAIYDSFQLGKIYMPNILKRQDYGLWLKILKKTGPIQGILDPLAIYRIRKNSVSSNKLTLIKYHYLLFRQHEKLPMVQSLYYLSINIINKIFQSKERM